jgi:hypothetical protein
MSKFDDLSSARRKANELMTKKEAERLSSRDKERQVEDAKIARLRGLRLAKEADDKAAAQVAKRVPPARRKPA